MILRRPDVDVQISVNKSDFHAGDELDARVALLPKGDFRVRHGRVELVCIETWVQRIDSQYGPSYHRKTNVLSSEDEVFMEGHTVRNGVPYSADLKATVPRDALPTLSGALVQKIEPGIAWAVKVDMDVARARDIKESQEITVVATPTPRGDRPVPTVTESERGGCPLTLELSQSEARSGDRVDGSLRAEPQGDVTASEVRVELVREEKFGNTAKNQVVDQVTFERDLSLQSGDEREWSVQPQRRPGRRAEPEDREVVGQVASERTARPEPTHRPEGRAGHRRRLLTARAGPTAAPASQMAEPETILVTGATGGPIGDPGLPHGAYAFRELGPTLSRCMPARLTCTLVAQPLYRYRHAH